MCRRFSSVWNAFSGYGVRLDNRTTRRDTEERPMSVQLNPNVLLAGMAIGGLIAAGVL
jgi:hypothetical protein